MAGAGTIDEIIDKIIKNYEKNLKVAVESATQKVTEDIHKYSMTCLEQYYSSYQPNSYDRSGSLQQAILPYVPVIKQGDKVVTSEVGIEYHASALDGAYSGSKKYTPTDGAWVLDNYLQGIHPATNGGRTTETSIYLMFQGSSPYEMMQKYLSTTVPALYQTYLMGAMASLVK